MQSNNKIQPSISRASTTTEHKPVVVDGRGTTYAYEIKG
jgi:hypothetical protein